MYLFKLMFSFLWNTYLRVELLECMVVFNFLRTSRTVLFSMVAALCIPTSGAGVPSSPHPPQHLLLVFWIIAILKSVTRYFLLVLICVSLMMSEVGHLHVPAGHLCVLFLYFCHTHSRWRFLGQGSNSNNPSCFSNNARSLTCCSTGEPLCVVFRKMFILILIPYFNCIVWGVFAIKLLIAIIINSLYSLNFNPLTDTWFANNTWFANIFSPSVPCLFILLISCIVQKLFSFVIVPHVTFAFGVRCKNHHQDRCHELTPLSF